MLHRSKCLAVLALGAVLAAGPALAARVTWIIAEVPPDTPADATLTLGTNLARWNPTTAGYAFTRDAKGRYTLSLDLRDGTNVEYKVTRGGWDTVEKNADGSEMKNRILDVKGDATVTLSVARWVDSPGAAAVLQSTVTGRVETLKDVKSPELGNSRQVLVYLPPGYARGARRYPVLYMQDGQNVFDAATAFVKQEWKADETAEAMAKGGREFIIVAVSNNADRKLEYSPFPAPVNGYHPRGKEYAAFLARTVKPLIDSRYRTLPDREHTGVLGASLGGLISLYEALAYPDVFGFAGVMSPSLSVADFSIFDWVRDHPSPKPLRVYLDMGDREADTPGWNLLNVETTEELGHVLEKQGSAVKVVIAPGARHNEDAWAPRLPAALEWFLGAR